MRQKMTKPVGDGNTVPSKRQLKPARPISDLRGEISLLKQIINDLKVESDVYTRRAATIAKSYKKLEEIIANLK